MTQTSPQGRKRPVAIIGALLLVALLGTGTVFAYTAFFSFSQTDSARYLPASTVFYASFDLQQIAQNPHKISQTDILGLAPQGLTCATGLDFQQDIQPWLGQGFTYAVVNVSKQANASGAVCLISTSDTNKSNAAIQKVMQTQKEKYDVAFSSITYNGTILHSDVDSAQGKQDSGVQPLVLGTFKDQVLVANTLEAADQVIDSFKGTIDTLAGNAAFSKAVGKMPGNRFGTLYVNTGSLADTLLSAGDDNGQVASLFPYPDGYGALQFTDAGIRLTFTLEAKAGTTANAGNGNTNASAGVVPDNALLYGGLGNLSAFYKQLENSSGGVLSDGPFQEMVGLAPGDPLFNAPLSFAVLPPSSTGGNTDHVLDGLVMLHASGDLSSADAKVKQALTNIHARTSTSTINDVTVTTIQTRQDGDTGGYKTQGYYAPLGRDLVFATTPNAITQAIDTYQGKQASLAELALFTQMVKQQPQNVAASLFINLENLANAPGVPGDDYKQVAGTKDSLLSRANASYLTATWTNQGITITEDIKLQ